MKAIIIDDEPGAQNILSTLLAENCPDVEIVAIADDVPEGVKAINKHHPDLIFLDIEMPGYTGFQLLEFFEKPNFEIIFTTAYSQYAIQAFEVSAIAYLLKPIDEEKLVNAVQKVQKQQENNLMHDKLSTLKSNLSDDGIIKKIALPVAEGLLFVETKDIIYLQADGSYTNIYLTNGPKLLISKKLGEFNFLLDLPPFFKPHRSFIINLQFVKQYIRQDGGYIIMDNDGTVSLSRDQKESFLKVFQS